MKSRLSSLVGLCGLGLYVASNLSTAQQYMPEGVARGYLNALPFAEIFVGALSVLSLVNIVLDSVLRDPAIQDVVRTVDVLLSVVFLVDFLVRLRRAPSRRDYFFSVRT